jgi:hypothetical protein
MSPFIENQKNQLIQILRQNGVTKASLFGSVARGEDTENSDIDFLVELQKGKTLLDLIGLNLELEEFLHKPVDTVTYASLHPLLRDRILQEREIIYE